MPSLMNLFTYQAAKVREYLAWVFGRLAEHHIHLYNNQGFAQQVVPGLL